MANAGVATEANLEATSKLMDSYGKLGIGADAAADAYTVLITATQDVEKSNKLLALSADLARARTMSMEEAARALTRAQAGNARIFTQFGIVLDRTKPKAEAIAEAMATLENRLSGQASAYTKTFAGQIAILTENIDALAEQIGMRVLPVLNKFVGGLTKSGEWVRKNQEFVIALGIAITVALIPAVVTLTKKLALLAVTILKSPIGRVAVIIFAVAYAFIKAYNSSEDFRKQMATVAKSVLTAAGYIVGAIECLVVGVVFTKSSQIIKQRISFGGIIYSAIRLVYPRYVGCRKVYRQRLHQFPPQRVGPVPSEVFEKSRLYSVAATVVYVAYLCFLCQPVQVIAHIKCRWQRIEIKISNRKEP
jgi:hypothetical protein